VGAVAGSGVGAGKARRGRSAGGSAPSRFVGRARELAELSDAVERGERLVTVVGPAGVGKTRIAHELLARVAGRWPAWFCELSDARSLDDVCIAVGRALEVPLTAAGSLEGGIAQLGHALAAHGAAVLVLDNFEQIAAHAPASVARWIEAAPELRLVVTSQERLRVEGERTLELGPLGVAPAGSARSEAAELLLDRAGRVAAGWGEGPSDAALVARIAERLDGMPLAIELAAARAGVLPPRALLERLEHRLELLGDTRRGGPARHATLRTAIGWSWDLLAPWEQQGLAECAVFRGGFTLGAVERVVALPDRRTALALVQSLRDRSLLRALPAPGVDEPRFAPYESVRAFALEHLADAAGVRERHAVWAHARAEELAKGAFVAGGAQRLRELGAERDNLHVALEHLGATEPPTPESARRMLGIGVALEALYTTVGPFSMLETVLGAALDHADRVPPARRQGKAPAKRAARGARPDAAAALSTLRAKALVARSYARRARGDFAAALADDEAALAAARRARDAGTEGLVLNALGSLHREQARLEEAERYYKRALVKVRSARDRRLEAIVIGNIGACYTEFGRADEAVEPAAEGLALMREAGDTRMLAVLQAAYGMILFINGRLTDARRQCLEALALLEEMGDDLHIGMTSIYLGTIAREAGQRKESKERLENAVALLSRVGAARWEGTARGYLGLVLWELGDLDAARAALDDAVDLARKARSIRNEGFFLAVRGGVDAAKGDLAEAARALADGEAILARARDTTRVVAARLLAGQLAVARATAAARAHDDRAAAAAIAEARGRLSEGAQEEERSADVRFARRALQRAVEACTAEAALVVGPAARWFRTAGGAHADLSHRTALRLMLAALVEAHARTRGTALPLETLMARAWPGEKMAWASGRNRVYVAITTLRKLGLRGLLQSRDDGWLLDPDAPVESG